MCSQRHIKQRAQPSGAPPTARPSKCTISSVTRAWSGMTTLKPQQRSTHVLEHAQTHHGIPLHTKDARNSTSDSARNSRARHPARPSKCTISSTVRARSGTPTHIIIYIYYIKNDICLLSFIMIFMIKILMLINILIYINQPLAHPNALSRALDGPGVGAHAHNRRNATRA